MVCSGSKHEGVRKARTLGKLGASWEGPWTVLRLMGTADSTVKVLSDVHKARVVAAANVKPYRGDEPVRITKCRTVIQPQLQLQHCKKRQQAKKTTKNKERLHSTKITRQMSLQDSGGACILWIVELRIVRSHVRSDS